MKKEESESEEQCEKDVSTCCEMRDEDNGTVLVNESSVRPHRKIVPMCCQKGCENRDVVNCKFADCEHWPGVECGPGMLAPW